LRVDRDQQRGVGLFLAHRDGVAADMLPAHPQHVALALRGVEAKRQCQTRLAADRMALFKPRDLARAPAMMAFALGCDIF
jgi:hypothetical protein